VKDIALAISSSLNNVTDLLYGGAGFMYEKIFYLCPDHGTNGTQVPLQQ
jgi:hypothetical protein